MTHLNHLAHMDYPFRTEGGSIIWGCICYEKKKKTEVDENVELKSPQAPPSSCKEFNWFIEVQSIQ